MRLSFIIVMLFLTVVSAGRYDKAKQRTEKMWDKTYDSSYYNTHKNKFDGFEAKVTEMGEKTVAERATKAGRALNFEDFKLNEGRIAARAKSTEADKKAAKKDVALSRREIIKGALKQLKDAGKDEKFTIERAKGGFSKKFEDKMIAKGIQYVDVKKAKAKTGDVNANDCANKADVLLSDLQADDAYEIVLEHVGNFSFKCLRPGKPLSKLTLTKKNETDFNTYKAECWDGSTWQVKKDDLHEDDSYTCDGYESYVASDSGVDVDRYDKAKQRTKKMWGDTYYNTHKDKFNDFENKVTEMSNKNSTARATKAGRALNFTDFKLDEKRVAARGKSNEAEKKDAKKDVALARREIIKGALKQLKDAGKDETFAIERTKGGFSKKFEDKMIAKGIQYVDVKKVKAKTGFNNASPDCANKADVILSDLQADDAYEIVLEEEGDFSFKCREPGKPLSKLTLMKKNETDFNTYKAECWDGSTWKVEKDDLHEDDSYTCDEYESYVASDSGTGTLPGCDGTNALNATSCADCPGYLFMDTPGDNVPLLSGVCIACGPTNQLITIDNFESTRNLLYNLAVFTQTTIQMTSVLTSSTPLDDYRASFSDFQEFAHGIEIHMCSDQGTEIDRNITSVMTTSYASGYTDGQASVTPEDGVTQADVDAANATGYADGYAAGGGTGQATANSANCVDKNDGPALKAAYVQLGQC